MAAPILQIAGTAIGFAFGGPIGAAVGGAIGGYVGGLIDGQQQFEGPRLSDLKVSSSAYGQNIPLIFGIENRVSGNLIWSTGLIEKSKKKKSGGKGGGGGSETTTYSYSTSVAIAICSGVEGRSPTFGKIWANGKLLINLNNYMVDSNGSKVESSDLPDNGYNFSSISLYPGNFTQHADSSIEADKGAGNAPAYRGTVYVVINNLQLGDYGNSIPNLEFEVGFGSFSLTDVINEICTRSGLENNQYSIDTKLNEITKGYVIARQSTSIAAIQPLMNAYAFDAAENGGQVRFTKRGKSPIAAIERSEMAARQRSDGGAEDTATFVRAPESSLPKSATVTYKDPERDYQDNTQLAERDGGDARNNINEQLAMTLDNNTARKIADRLLWESWVGRLSARFSVSDKWSFLKPSDVVTIKLAGVMSTFRIVNFTRGFDGIIEANSILEDPFIYDGATTGSSALIPENEVQFVGDTFAYCYNAPIVYPNESDYAFSWAMDAEESGWRGGLILRSTDDIGYTEIGNVTTTTRNTTGIVAGVLPDANTEYWDRVNTITVTLLHPEHELESFPEGQILNGLNAFWLGSPDGSSGEIIQFATATLINANPKVYELSNLLRGRRGTEHYTGSHADNEVFVYFEAGLMSTSDFGQPDWDKLRYYKGVSIYQAIPDALDTQEFINTGEKARPLSPVQAKADRDESNNAAITWIRRSRGLVPEIGYGEVPLNETTELYELDVYNGVNIVRTITVTSPEASYSAAEQIADGLVPGNNIDIKIYQISETRGRGHAGEFTV